MSDLTWISPVDRARMGNSNDLMTRLDGLETNTRRLSGVNVTSSDLGDFAEDIGVLRSGSIYWGSGDPYDLTTLPVGVLAEALGIHIYNQTEVGRFGDLNGFLFYAASTYGIGIGDPNAYLTYDPTNGLRIKGTVSTLGNFPRLFDVWMEPVVTIFDGVRVIFDSKQPIVTGSLHVIQNGLWLLAESGTNDDYDTSPPNRLSLSPTPVASDVLLADYTKLADHTYAYNDVPTNVIHPWLFDLAFNVVTGSINLSINGITQAENNDFNGGSAGVGFHLAPAPTDTMFFCYQTVANTHMVRQEKLSPINGATTVYTLANNYQPGSPLVVLNGVKQSIGHDYTESAVNQITFTNPPQTGDMAWVTYLKP